eukprot:5648695-Karenia_brevis.AAC.1
MVVCINPKQSSVWVSMQGVLVKCSAGRVRPATDEEWMGSESIRILSVDAKQRLEHGGQRGFVDAIQEEGPPDEVASPESP